MNVPDFVTGFADQAVVLPLLVVVALALWAGGWQRGAIAWLACVGGTLGVMGMLKLGAALCGGLPPGSDLQSPSGHTAAAASAYGALVFLLGRRRPIVAVVLVAAAIASGVGLTRILLGAHVLSEVVVGGVVGVTGAASAVALAGARPSTMRPFRAVLAVVVIAILCHGRHVEAEAAIRASGAWLQARLPDAAAACRV